MTTTTTLITRFAAAWLQAARCLWVFGLFLPDVKTRAMQLSKKEIWRKEQENLKKGLATPLPADNYGARLMRKQGWRDGAGLGRRGTGRTENLPLWQPWLSGCTKASDTTRPPRFVRASTNKRARDTTRPSYSAGSAYTWDSPWCREHVVQQSWASSDTWDLSLIHISEPTRPY